VDKDTGNDVGEVDDEYDEEIEDEAPTRMPGNVLGPVVFVAAIATGGLLIGGYSTIAGIVSRPAIDLGLALALFVSGLAAAAIAIGLWRGFGWAHGFAVVGGGILALSGLVAFRNSGSVLGLALGAVMVWCLTRPDAKEWCGA
jgi:hypothetical protein